jgi:hypothetical protein
MSIVNVEALIEDLNTLVNDLEEEKKITTDFGMLCDGEDRAYHSGEAVAFVSAIHMVKNILRKYN